MKHQLFKNACLLVGFLPFPLRSTFSQTSADQELLAAILKIRAIDHHSHAMPAFLPDSAELDKLDPFGKAPFEYPVRLRITNPEYIEAWRALYGYKYQDMTAQHAREALVTKLALMAEQGTNYPAWVLDQAGIETTLINMKDLGSGQTAPRFLWVPRADGFLFPFAGEAAMINWFRKEAGLDSAPASLNAYLGMIRRQLEQWQKASALAIKFAIAYLRPLDFTQVSEKEANLVFERYKQNEKTTARDHKSLQDFLFHFMAREAGRLGLAVHIHTGIGADPQYNLSGANPLLLEPMLNDVTLRQTSFVLIHGGWPFEREAGAMLMKPNVYADFSAQTFLRSTEALSETLRAWLEWYPKKVLFGTDAYSENTPLANWEEKTWLSARTSRQALALALTRMMAAGQITRARAEELARMVMRENAAKLYRLENR